MRTPTRDEVFGRLIRPDRLTDFLEGVVSYAYDRFDGELSVGRAPVSRCAWGVIGDRADDVRCLWIRRPVR